MTALTNEWYIFHEVIDRKTCNKIKRLARNNWEESSVDTSKGTTDEERKTGKKGDYKPDPKVRISDLAWITDQWVYDTIWPFMQEANREAGWGYHIKAAESMQITLIIITIRLNILLNVSVSIIKRNLIMRL